jgi:hypothetical protein
MGEAGDSHSVPLPDLLIIWLPSMYHASHCTAVYSAHARFPDTKGPLALMYTSITMQIFHLPLFERVIV